MKEAMPSTARTDLAAIAATNAGGGVSLRTYLGG